MPWYEILIIIYLAANALLTVAYVGRRVTISPASATLTVVTHVAIIVGVLALAHA